MEINRGRNCYSCGEFGHLAWNCKNWRMISQERRMEYGNNNSNNLKEEENLVVLN